MKLTQLQSTMVFTIKTWGVQVFINKLDPIYTLKAQTGNNTLFGE